MNSYAINQFDSLVSRLKASFADSPKEKLLANILINLISCFKHLFESFSQYEKKLADQANRILGLNLKLARCFNIVRSHELASSNDMVANSELFKTVYDPQAEINAEFEKQLEMQEKEIETIKRTLQPVINNCKEMIKLNEISITELYNKLERHKTLGKELKPSEPISLNQLLTVSFACSDIYSSKEKYKNLLKKALADKTETKRIFVNTEEPISNEELRLFIISFIGMNTKNTLKELEIENAYVSEGKWIGELIENNAKSLSRVTINKTLLDATGAITILTSMQSSKVKLEEFNLDENKFYGTDLNLLVKSLSGLRIKRFSIRKNQFDIHSIESFVKASEGFDSLEEIDVGNVEITDQKELEWRTNYTSLTFQKIPSDS